MTMKDIGSTGLRQYGGWVREEFLPALQGRMAVTVYREMMDNSPIIGAVIFAITQSMRKVEWRIEAADDSSAAQAEADFVESIMTDMSHPWEDFVTEALSMLGYGFAPHEIVYKRRAGRKPPRSETASSDYDDGRIGVHKLPIRGQDTVLKWFFDVNGDILGLTQQPYVGQLIDLPIEKMLLFRPSAHKGNPEGRSILRTAYRSWFFTKRLEELEGICLERMSGVPVMRIPAELIRQAGAGDVDAIAALNEYKKLITTQRLGEQMGLVIPSDTYSNANGPTTALQYEFTLVTPQHSTSVDFDKPIERHKLDMLYTVLCDFIQMGHSSRGTQSLAISKVDLFFQAIEGWLDSIAATLNRYLLPRLWDLNGLDYKLMPRIVPDMAQRVDLDSLGAFIYNLAQSGMVLFPDDDLENYIRDVGGMPDEIEEALHGDDGTRAKEQQAMRGQQYENASAPPPPPAQPGQHQPGADQQPKGAPNRAAKPTQQMTGTQKLEKILSMAMRRR